MIWERRDYGAEGPGSLLWVEGRLFDVSRGWLRLDEPARSVFTAFGKLDAAVPSPRGDLCALVDSDGTKALLLTPGGRVVREINRSWYCATSYRYPLALFTLPDGQTGIAHCPEHYNVLEIEVAATGERLTARPQGGAADVFHSRLQASPSGARLLSAGWVWHPLGVVGVFDVREVLDDPRRLDAGPWSDPDSLASAIDAEVSGACWVDEDVVFATSAESLNNDDGIGTHMMCRWSAAQQAFVWQRSVSTGLGDLVSFHGDFLSLNGHPQLFDGRTGTVLYEWPDVNLPSTDGSFFVSNVRAGSALAAVDPTSRRVAFSLPDRVVVFTQQ